MAEEVSDDIQDIEFEIRRMSGGRFQALLHIYRPDRGWRVENRTCASEREAMNWIDARLGVRGFHIAYPSPAPK